MMELQLFSAALIGLTYGDDDLIATGSMHAALEIHAAKVWWHVKERDKMYEGDFTRINRVVGVSACNLGLAYITDHRSFVFRCWIC